MDMLAGLQTNVPYIPKPPSKPLRIHYIEEVILDPITNIVTEQESSRPWNDATDWPLYNKATEAYMFLCQTTIKMAGKAWVNYVMGLYRLGYIDIQDKATSTYVNLRISALAVIHRIFSLSKG